MPRVKQHMVSKAMLDAAVEVYKSATTEEQKGWFDHVATTQVSDEAGGVVELVGDHDWKIGFLIYRLGRADLLPRED